MRKGAIVVWLIVLFVCIAAIFWHNEWVYNLPTPLPSKYKAVKEGSFINLGDKIVFKDRPVFIHFFNPDCPCSRFNMTHFKSLIKKYEDKVDFKMVVLAESKDYDAKGIKKSCGVEIPVLFDSAIAAACGVYSTPQAVIIQPDKTLYYRGNYNKSRYCTDKKSNYAEIALNALLNQTATPAFNHFALRAYGCQLPFCKK